MNAPAGFRNVSDSTVEKYQTDDGNAIAQHYNARGWVVLPRGRDSFYVTGKANALREAVRVAAEIAAADGIERAAAGPIGTRIAGTYGTNEVMRYERSEGGTWRRVDLYHPNDGRPAIEERRFCLDGSDVTHVVSTYVAQIGEKGPHVRAYDSCCSSCYLGHSHTTAKHDAAVKP